jgi:trimethylamine--corrinoid protein Co-methyltransferase
MEVSPETLAIDVIEKVGPGGHFLSEKHTRKHMRKSWVPGLGHVMDAGGQYRDIKEVAREKISWILKNHEVEPLPAEKHKEIKKILVAADRELIE